MSRAHTFWRDQLRKADFAYGVKSSGQGKRRVESGPPQRADVVTVGVLSPQGHKQTLAFGQPKRPLLTSSSKPGTIGLAETPEIMDN